MMNYKLQFNYNVYDNVYSGSFAILTVSHLRNMLEMEGPLGFLSFRPFVGIKP